MKNSSIRIVVLLIMVVISAIFFVLTVIPNSPFINTNICMENEKAAKMYASANSVAKNKFIEKRNDDCKDILKFAKEPVTAAEQIDTCNMVDSVIDASNHYIELHSDNKRLINNELNYISKNIMKYSFCPQYKEVVDGLNKTREKHVKR